VNNGSELQTEIRDLLSEQREDRYSCPKATRKKAMDFLARREYGRIELVKKLAEKGYHSEMAEQAIAKLAQEGLQSDQRFAENFVQSRIHQGKGPVRIRVDLGQRGIGDSLVDTAIQESGADWAELASAVRNKKFGHDRPADFTKRAKQMRFLQYRGFEQRHIQAAVGGD
jgi:regulatory protein